MVGLDNSSEMIREARRMLATSHMECFERLTFFEGDLTALVEHLHTARTAVQSVGDGLSLRSSRSDQARVEERSVEMQRIFGAGTDGRALFTHLWSTCTKSRGKSLP